MSISILIPARGGSVGIPRKALVNLCGRPLIWWSIQQALQADIDYLTAYRYVVTDDEEIATFCHSRIAVVREPPRDGTTTMEEVIRCALGKIAVVTDWIMVLQPTSPLRLASHIAGSLEKVKGYDGESLVSVTPNRKFQWEVRPEFYAETIPLGHDKSHRPMRQELGLRYAENGSIYLMRRDLFLQEGTRFCGKTVPYIMPGWTAQEIDSLEDLDMVRLILSDRLRQGKDGVTR